MSFVVVEQFADDDEVFGATVEHTEMKECDMETPTPDTYAINSNIRSVKCDTTPGTYAINSNIRPVEERRRRYYQN